MLEIKRIEKLEWRSMSKDAHVICFNEVRDPYLDRIDYALLSVQGRTPVTYCTVRELDAESCYWQYGGSFPGSKDTVLSYRGTHLSAQWCLERYKRISFYVQNTNAVMIKIALKVGFKIIGVRTFKGAVMVEFLLENDATAS